MRKALLLIFGCIVMNDAYAQVPVKRAMGLVQKAIYTTCAPCGGWGWILHEEIMADNMTGATPNGFVLSVYGIPIHNYYNSVADTLGKWAVSWPNWAMNNVNRTVIVSGGNIDTFSTRRNIKKAVDSFAAIPPVASTGFTCSVSGSTLIVNTKTTFWAAATGTYNLAMYIVEDSVYGSQAGQAGYVYHRNVLRGQVSGTEYGEQIASGTIGANSGYTKNYIYAITDTSWKKSRLKVIAVLWKKAGSVWELINMNSLKSAPTGVGSVPVAVDQLIVYPNPANNRLRLSGVLIVASDAHIDIANAIGQTVFKKTIPYQSNQINEEINLDNIASGIYTLRISVNGAEQCMEKLIIAR